MARPRKQPEFLLYPHELDTPVFIDAFEAYWDWRSQQRDKLRVTDVDGMKRDWLRSCKFYGLAGSLAALHNTKANRYVGLTVAPRALIKGFEDELAQKAQPQSNTDDQFRDVLKIVLREQPEYPDQGWTLEKCLSCGFAGLPFSLKAELRNTATTRFGVTLK